MSTENTGRRQKLVMALGIATIILFSANLLSVLVKHFWPDKAEYTLFTAERADAVETAPHAEAQFHYKFDVDVDTRHARHKKHRIVMRLSDCEGHSHDDALDAEIAEMEAAASRLQRELSRELNQWDTHEIEIGDVKILDLTSEALDGNQIKVLIRDGVEGNVEIELEDAMREMESQIKESVERIKEKAEREAERAKRRRSRSN